jgi:hypothetical protein
MTVWMRWTVLCPSPAVSTALEKTFEFLDRGLAGLGLQPRPQFCALFTIRPLTSRTERKESSDPTESSNLNAPSMMQCLLDPCCKFDPLILPRPGREEGKKDRQSCWSKEESNRLDRGFANKDNLDARQFASLARACGIISFGTAPFPECCIDKIVNHGAEICGSTGRATTIPAMCAQG